VEIRQLRYFLAVAEELSFTRAADRCQVSQPPLSRQIAHLEEEIGVRLLDRDQHSVSLTAAGRVFLEEARAILERIDGSRERTVRAASGLTGRLVIGFGSSTTYALLPMLVRNFRTHYPDVQLVLQSMPVITQVEALRAGEIDVGVLRLPVYDELISTHLVHHEDLVVALPADHPLARVRKVLLEDLAGCSFVTYRRSRGLSFHSDLIALCRAAGFEPRIEQEASSTEGIVGVVACSGAVAIVPATARRLDVDGVCYRPLAPPPGTAANSVIVDFAIAWLTDNPSPTTAGFVAATRLLPTLVKKRSNVR
jgi:LysR family transcriptional regulator, benzoate and cis,cis-muconate-responsive activator of ben and cat genes